MDRLSLKILYISYDGAKEPIPQSQVLPYLCQFSSRGFDIYWLSFDKSNSFGSKKEKFIFKKELLNNGIKWYSLTYHKKPLLFAKAYDIALGFIYASYIILKKKIDIIHGRSEVASLIAIFLKKVFRINFIYDRRGFIAEDYIEGGIWKTRGSPIYKLSLYIDRRLLLESAWIIVLTKKMRDILANTYINLKNKISVIPCCVDEKRFTFCKNKQLRLNLNIDGKFTFLYSGSLGTWYMLDEMLHFFKLAKDIIPNAHFLIFTLSDLNIIRDSIQRNRLGLNDFTMMSISPDKIHEYISLGKVALVFIKPVFSKLASSPTKFAEALACGTPIIINSGIGDTEEIIRNEKVGIIVEGFNENSYRKAIDELLNLLREEPQLQERCRSTAIKYFALEDGVYKYLQIYRKISHNKIVVRS